MAQRDNDFSKGSMVGNILGMAVPMVLAQLINVLYSVVDRMYIGRIGGIGTMALTGVGLTFPVITMVSAFASLFGMGGAPLCSIARGAGDAARARRIMCCSYTMLLVSGAALTAAGFLTMRPVLYLFGASDVTFPYARDYLSVYLCGTVFVMLSLGMNSFINAQGFGRVGMLTVLCGALANILLDPVFIFVLGMGVRGAALATVLSQFLSAAWVLRFLSGGRALLRLEPAKLVFDRRLIGRITALGLSNFTMSVTTGAVQVVCNAQLALHGGDLYVGVMTVINSVREILSMPVNGVTGGALPVLAYNYGAREYRRVKSGILFMTAVSVSYTLLAWLAVFLCPGVFIRLFNDDPALLSAGVPALKAYFFGFFLMSLQFAGQTSFQALGKARHAIFFSIFRKVVVVIPLTLLLPRLWGLGVMGVFWAEPVSNLLGGVLCFTTMLLTVWPALSRPKKQEGFS